MEQIFAYIPWADDDFKEMNARLFDFQENNYAFWDFAEMDVIEKYLARCKQLEPKLREFAIGETLKHNFYLNWKNLLTALDFVVGLRNDYEPMPAVAPSDRPPVARDHTIDPCDGSFASQPRYYDEIPIKRAIRENRAIYQWGTAMKYLDKVMPALEAVSADFAACAKIQKSDRVEMKVSDFLRKRGEQTLESLMLADIKRTDKLVLLADDD